MTQENRHKLLQARRELVLKQNEELEACRCRYLAECESVRRKYEAEYNRLSFTASPAVAVSIQ